MTDKDLEHQHLKDKLRQEAIDKEVLRLKTINRKQSVKISNLKKSLYFLIFFFASLITIALLKGFLDFSDSKQKSPDLRSELQESSEIQALSKDSLYYYKNKYNQLINENIKLRNEAGLIFRVQIGAFKKVNLDKYETNFVAFSQEKYDSINQYTLGKFADYQQARDFCDIIRKMGFNDAFIIATKNGKKVAINKLSNDELGVPESDE